MSAVVYRMYNADYRLLYVGQTMNALQRVQSHSSTAAWFPDVDTITVEHFASRSEALQAEIEAIRNEKPQHNVQHAKPQRKKRAPVDESTWRTTDLHINPAFLLAILKIDGRDIDSIQFTSRERIDAMVAGEGVDLTEALTLCNEVGCSVGALFPNRQPQFDFEDGRFVGRRDRQAVRS